MLRVHGTARIGALAFNSLFHMSLVKYNWPAIVFAALLVVGVLLSLGLNSREKSQSQPLSELATSNGSGGKACCDKPPSRAGYFKELAEPAAK